MMLIVMNFQIQKTVYVFSSLALILLLVTRVNAQDLPRWELGVGLGGQVLRDYRGSKEGQIQAYPIPLFIYRGSFLKADRDGVRGEFLANDRLEFNLSGETSLNGQSDDNELREGMPELESAFELGPSLNINLTGENFREGWQLRLPVRGVITAGDSGVHFRGYNFNPRFSYTAPDIFSGWRVRGNIGVLYSSERYHDYYYSVDEKFVTDTRPFYKAKEGFSGSTIKLSISKKQKKFWYGLSFRYDNLSGASFENSPLVETKDYFAISFLIAWMNWQSVE